MAQKKKIERFYLDRFLALLGKVPDEVWEGEAPDFIISLQGKRIGIEVTEYHSGQKGEGGKPRRAIEVDWGRLQEVIMGEVEKYEELSGTNGLLFFKKLELPPKSQYKEFTDELRQLSIEMINAGIQEAKPDRKYHLLYKYLIKHFIEKIGVYIKWDWNHIVSSIGLYESELINSIQRKLATDYKDRLSDEVWLLIVSGYRLSQAMTFNLEFKLSSFHKLNQLIQHSKFKRVFIYQFLFNVIFEWPGWSKIEVLSL